MGRPSDTGYWRQIFEETGGCPIRAAELTGAPYKAVMWWRGRIVGGIFRKKGSVKGFSVDHVEELRAALLAKISPTLMQHRFGCSRGTLRKVIDYYELPRIRAPRTPKRPSKVW